jgi:hypothetical protein
VARRNNFPGVWRFSTSSSDLPDEATNFLSPAFENRAGLASYNPTGEITMKSLCSEITATPSESMITLVRDERIEIADAIGCQIVCLSGSVWLSCTEKKGMMRLDAGHSFVIQCKGNAIVQAGGDSVVALTDSPSVRLGLGRLPAKGLHVMRMGPFRDHELSAC